LDEPPSSPGDLLGFAKSAGTLIMGTGVPHDMSGNAIGGWLLPAIFLLFLMSFLFSGLEAALFSFGRYRLRELCVNGHGSAIKLSRLFVKPGRLVSVLVICNITANVILTALWTKGSFQLAERMDVSTGVFVAISEVVLLTLIVLFAEIAPKTLFMKYSETISLTFASFMVVTYWTVWIFAVILEFISNILLLPFRGAERTKNGPVTEEEIIDIVTVGESEGVIDEHEKELIHSIIEFGDRQVSEVMIPRTDVVAVEINTDIKEAMGIIVSSGFSRIPVFDQTIDKIVGILMAKDILPLIGRGGIEGTTISDIMMDNVYFIPETKPVSELFKEFQMQKIYMAIAVDEHGGTAGVITTEDMLEEIVGEITDEYDPDEPVMEQQPDGSHILEGKLALHELEELFDLELESEDYDTVGGLILAMLGSIPKQGQVTEDANLRLKVLEVEGNRVTKLRVWKIGGEVRGEGSE